MMMMMMANMMDEYELHTGQKFATFEEFDAFVGKYVKRTQQIFCVGYATCPVCLRVHQANGGLRCLWYMASFGTCSPA